MYVKNKMYYNNINIIFAMGKPCGNNNGFLHLCTQLL